MFRQKCVLLSLGLAAFCGLGDSEPLFAQDHVPSAYEYGFLNQFRVTDKSASDSEFALQLPKVPIHATGYLDEPESEGDSDDAELSLDERLARVEKGWSELDKAWSKFEAAEKKKKADAALKPTLKINGRIHADNWDFINTTEGIGNFENPSGAAIGTDPEDVFAFRRIRLEMKGDILENMLWRIQIDFNNPAVAEMKDVYLGFKELPYNQEFLIGNQKRPLGLDHLNSSRYNVFLERPMVIETFNSDARRPGVCMYGYTDDELFHWRYGAFYLENISRDGRYFGDYRQMSINGRLSSSPWYDDASDGRGYFHWAVAGMLARPDGDATAADANGNESRFNTRPEARSASSWLDTRPIAGADWYEILALETILNVGPTQIVGEYQHTFVQRDSGFADTQFGGGYIYASYFLTGEHIPYERKSGTIGRVVPYENFFLVDRCSGGHGTGWGAWNVAARYSYLDLSDGDVLGGVGNSGTLALNWHWNPYAKVQFNLIYGEIDQRQAVNGFTAGDYLIAGTRFAIEF